MKKWYVVNLDKMEYIDPASFEDGDNLTNHAVIPTALYLLVLAPVGYVGLNGLKARTGSAVGHWCGDRVAVVSNVTQDGDIPGVHGAGSIFSKCVKRTERIPGGYRVKTGVRGEFKNISGWVREDLKQNKMDTPVEALPVVINFNGVEYTR